MHGWAASRLLQGAGKLPIRCWAVTDASKALASSTCSYAQIAAPLRMAFQRNLLIMRQKIGLIS